MNKTSKQIAENLGINHSDLMKFYWKLENKIIENRNLIECTLVVSKPNYLSNVCPSLELLFYSHFNINKYIES
jgi:hypothetical protein